MLKSIFSRHPNSRRRLRTLVILSSGILANFAVTPFAFPATFTWTNVDGNWSEAAKWQGGVVPAGAATTDLVFGGVGAATYTATNNLTDPFPLNTLTLNSSSTGTPILAGTGLAFLADDTAAGIIQNGSGGFLLNLPIVTTAALEMSGTGTGSTELVGEISGGGSLIFQSGNWRLSNQLNSFAGGVTINSSAFLEIFPAFGGDLNVTPGGSYLGANTATPLTINGGTAKFTTTANIILGRLPVLFGTNGGILDMRNGSGTPGVQGGGIATAGGGDFNLTLNNAPENIAVIKFNGGEVGQSTGNAADGNWSTGNNALRINSFAGTGPLRIEITNGAMLRGSTGASGTINVPLTVRGVVGGDPTSGSDGTVNTGLSTTTGRYALDSQSITNHTRGLTFEGAVQVAVVGATRALDGNIVVAGTASGAPGYVAFSGRGTGTQLNGTVNTPGGTAVGQNVLWIGQGQNDTLTIQPGGIAVFDPRIRTDTGGSNGNGVLLDGTAVINAGGLLRIAQSVSNFTPGVAQTAANVGDIIIRGDIRGEGNSTTESVLEIALPAPQAGAAISTGVPFIFAGDTTAGQRPYGGLRFEDVTGNADFIINGTGFGGLRINGIARPNALIQNGTADPVSTLTKINDALTPTRLSRISGTGGYVSVAPAGQTYLFPAGGEWSDADVGFKVIDHNTAGADVSFAALTSWNRNLAVDTGATLNLGPANPFTLGGTVHGKGIIVGTGNLVIAPTGSISPGLGDIGTLTVNSPLTLNGNLVIGVQPASSDVLNIGGNLLLGGPLVLSGTFGTTDLEIARYSGTLTGTFSSITGLSPDFTVDYGAGSNGSIRLVHTVLGTLTWDGTPGSTWSGGGGNWKAGGIFSNGNKVQFDDSATGSTSITVSGSDVSPNLITVNNTTKPYSITSTAGAAIVGGAQLIKNGTGILTLSGPASFGGGIAVNAGEVRVGAPESLPNIGPITVSLNAKLETQGNFETVGDLVVDGQVTGGGTISVASLTLGNGVTFTPNLVLRGKLTKTGTNGTMLAAIDFGGATRTVDVAAGTAPELTFGGVVSNGGLNKAGAGTLVLSNPNNTFTAGLSVLAGLVRALVAGALPANNNVTVAAGGTVEANGFNSILRLLDLSGTFQTAGGNLTVTGIAGANSGSLSLGGGSLTIDAQGSNSYAGALVDAGSLTKIGTGTQGLSGVNNMTSDIQLNAGILGIGGVSSAGTGAINVAPGATLDLGANITNIVNLNGGTMGNTGGRNYQGTLNVTADSFITNSDPDAPNTGADLVILGNGLQGTGNLTVRGITGIGGVDGSSGVRARSTAPSTYSGTVTVLNSTKFESQMSEGGTNPIGTAKVRLTGGTFTGGLNGTYSQFNIRTAGGNPVFGTDVEVVGSGLANINPVQTAAVTTDQRFTLGNLKIGAGQTLGVNKNDATPVHTVIFTSVTLTGGNATFAPNTLNMGYSGSADLVLGPISESAPGAGIVMDGQATLFLNGANTYTGPTILQRGTTRAAAAGALPATTALTMAGGVLDLHDNAGASFDQTIRSLSGTSGDITNTDAVARTLTVDQPTASVYSGTISGALGITKRGAGSLTLAGFNSFNGPTRVEAGTLVANGTNPAPITVANSGTLAGIGTVGNLLGQNGGRVSPGDGATGMLSAGTITLDGAALAIELFGTSAGTGYDQLRASGAVALTNNPTLILTLGFDPADKIDLFTIILNNNTGSVNGTFANLPNGATFLAGAQQFQISYADDASTPVLELTGGNDVSLLAVPEPASALLLFAGMSFLGLCNRSRRVTR